jgi:hypothetical protein
MLIELILLIIEKTFLISILNHNESNKNSIKIIIDNLEFIYYRFVTTNF